MVEYPCGNEQIEKILPHRAPFIWMSRVLSCTPGVCIVAELDIDPQLPLFKGHFPTHPVFPGVLIMEALAQTASFCILVEDERKGSVGFLTGIDNAKFRAQVSPGDTIRLEATIVKSNARMCVADVVASVGDKVCAQATQKYVLGAQE